jgi:hypothetical protein
MSSTAAAYTDMEIELKIAGENKAEIVQAIKNKLTTFENIYYSILNHICKNNASSSSKSPSELAKEISTYLRKISSGDLRIDDYKNVNSLYYPIFFGAYSQFYMPIYNIIKSNVRIRTTIYHIFTANTIESIINEMNNINVTTICNACNTLEQCQNNTKTKLTLNVLQNGGKYDLFSGNNDVRKYFNFLGLLRNQDNENDNTTMYNTNPPRNIVVCLKQNNMLRCFTSAKQMHAYPTGQRDCEFCQRWKQERQMLRNILMSSVSNEEPEIVSQNLVDAVNFFPSMILDQTNYDKYYTYRDEWNKLKKRKNMK